MLEPGLLVGIPQDSRKQARSGADPAWYSEVQPTESKVKGL